MARTPSISAASSALSGALPLGGGDRPLQIVGDHSSSRAKSADRVLPRLLCRPLGPPSRVLGLRQRTQQTIAQGCVLGDQRCRIDRLGGHDLVYHVAGACAPLSL